MATHKKQPTAQAVKQKGKESSTLDTQQWIGYALLVLALMITYFVYLPSTDYGFTNWDDDVYVTENLLVTENGTFKDVLVTPVGGNYHPLTILSLQYDYHSVLNPEDAAKRIHSTNILFHLLNIVLVAFLIRMLFPGRLWLSIACAWLFAIHPMHVESVAWIAERKDVLYTFFFLFALIAYVRYRKTNNLLWIVWVIVFFVLSLSSKPAAVILPLILLTIDYLQKRDFKTVQLWIEKIPFFILSLVGGWLTIKAQQGAGAIDYTQNFSFFQKLLFAFYGLLMYSVKLIWPFNLSNLYPFPNVKGQALGVIYYVAPVLVVCAFAGLFWLGRKLRPVMFGLFFFLINVALVLQVFTVGQAIIADRYTYVSYIGLFIILFYWLDEKEGSIKWVSVALLALLSSISLSQTPKRIPVWKNSEALWTNVIEQFSTQSPVPYNNRGSYFLDAKDYVKAEMDFRTALKLSPDYHLSWSNLGNVFFDQNRNDSAIYCYDKALSLKSDLWESLANRGSAKGKLGDLKGSVEDLTAALNMNPQYTEAYRNRALSYYKLSQFDNAIADDREVVKRLPNDHESYNEIGVLLQNQGKFEESVSEFTKAISIQPRNGIYFYSRSRSWFELGYLEKAQADAVKAEQLTGKKLPADYRHQLQLP